MPKPDEMFTEARRQANAQLRRTAKKMLRDLDGLAAACLAHNPAVADNPLWLEAIENARSKIGEFLDPEAAIAKIIAEWDAEQPRH